MGLIFAAAEFSLEGEDFVEADEGEAVQDLGPVDEPDPIFPHPAVEDLYRSQQVDGDVVMSRLGVPERVDPDLDAASSHDVYVSYVRERSVSEHRCTAEQGYSRGQGALAPPSGVRGDQIEIRLSLSHRLNHRSGMGVWQPLG